MMPKNETSAVIEEEHPASERDTTMSENMENDPNKSRLKLFAYWLGFASMHADTQGVIAEFRIAEKEAQAFLKRSRAAAYPARDKVVYAAAGTAPL